MLACRLGAVGGGLWKPATTDCQVGEFLPNSWMRLEKIKLLAAKNRKLKYEAVKCN